MKANATRNLALVYSAGADGPLQPALDSYALARALRALARRAECGELVGAALVVWKDNGASEMQVAGILERDNIKAHYAASLLADALLHDGGHS